MKGCYCVHALELVIATRKTKFRVKQFYICSSDPG